jgi:hypothetical protein
MHPALHLTPLEIRHSVLLREWYTRALLSKNSDAACTKGCASCSIIDIEKIEKDINARSESYVGN